MIIYCLTNANTGKKYIGKTTKDILVRFKQHIYNAFQIQLDFYLYQSMRKHGSDAFSYEILERCTNEKELDEREKYWIEKLETYKPEIGYNSTMGGDGGHITPEIRAKISKANTGKIQTLESREKKSKAHKGKKKHTAESRQLIGKASKNRPPISEETRRKQSESQKKAWERRRNNTKI